MRVLVLIHEFPPIGGGGGAAARDICIALAKRGHDVKVLTAHFDGLPKRETIQGVDVMRLASLRREAFRARLPEMTAFVLSALTAGAPLARRFHPDVIHAHFAVPAGAAAWTLSRLTQIPCVLTAHLGDVPGGVPEKTGKWFRIIQPFTQPIWRGAKRVVAVSQFTRALALQHYAIPIDVIPNGVDVSALRPQTLEIHNPPRLVFAGRFVEQKNPLQIVRVLSKLRHLAWTCSLLGDGVLREAVRREIESLDLADRFHLPGWVTPEQVIAEFQKSDILFMPSRSEGLPVVGVQALACGLALVVGRAGGFVDLVNGNGAICDPDDTESLTSALSSLLASPPALLAARQKSLDLAQPFDIERVADAYENLFREVSGK
ncbi:MAG: Glycogen synthase [Anaerolineales bacterium]|nr:Glycogen synthase [Anaerolineales bacterium]